MPIGVLSSYKNKKVNITIDYSDFYIRINFG